MEAVIALSIFFLLVSWFKKKVSDPVFTRGRLGLWPYFFAYGLGLPALADIGLPKDDLCRALLFNVGIEVAVISGIGFICCALSRIDGVFNQGAASGMGCLPPSDFGSTVLLFSAKH